MGGFPSNEGSGVKQGESAPTLHRPPKPSEYRQAQREYARIRQVRDVA